MSIPRDTRARFYARETLKNESQAEGVPGCSTEIRGTKEVRFPARWQASHEARRTMPLLPISEWAPCGSVQNWVRMALLPRWA